MLLFITSFCHNIVFHYFNFHRFFFHHSRFTLTWATTSNHRFVLNAENGDGRCSIPSRLEALWRTRFPDKHPALQTSDDAIRGDEAYVCCPYGSKDLFATRPILEAAKKAYHSFMNGDIDAFPPSQMAPYPPASPLAAPGALHGPVNSTTIHDQNQNDEMTALGFSFYDFLFGRLVGDVERQG